MISYCRWFSLTRLDGSFRELYEFVRAGGFPGLISSWPRPSLEAWSIIAFFGAVQAALQLYMPGKEYHGPKTPKGNIPVYKANGLQCYSATLVVFTAAWRWEYCTSHLNSRRLQWTPKQPLASSKCVLPTLLSRDAIKTPVLPISSQCRNALFCSWCLRSNLSTFHKANCMD